MVVLRQRVVEENAAVVVKEQGIAFALVDVHSQATFPRQGLSAGERGFGVQRVDNPCDTTWRQLEQVIDNTIGARSFVLVSHLERANQSAPWNDICSINTSFRVQTETAVTHSALAVVFSQGLG